MRLSLGITSEGLLKRTPLYIATAGLLGIAEAEPAQTKAGGVLLTSAPKRTRDYKYLELSAILGRGDLVVGLGTSDAVDIDVSVKYTEGYLYPSIESRSWALANLDAQAHLPLRATARGTGRATANALTLNVYKKPTIDTAYALALLDY